MYRKTYARIDLGNLQQNIKNAAANLPENCGIVAVVKADAYGHGALTCALAAKEAGVCMLAVALAEEGLPLKEAELPIMILGRSNREQLQLAVSLGLEPCVFTPDDILYLQEECEKQDKTCDIHLKFDTGMCRVGIRGEEELAACVEALQKCERVMLKGAFTHFANSDAKNKTHAEKQHVHFLQFIDLLKQKGYDPLIHADNSAGTIDLPQFSHDMVRFGISMYGYYPSGDVSRKVVKLLPVMQVEAEVSHVKTVEEGACVGYGSTFITQRETKVATIAIGYGDGYNRLLSNKGRMIVTTEEDSFYAPIIGRVCMDQTMIDVTDIIGTIGAGDTVVALGSRGGKTVDADEIADICGTISYEVLLDFNARVPRRYVNSNNEEQ